MIIYFMINYFYKIFCADKSFIDKTRACFCIFYRRACQYYYFLILNYFKRSKHKKLKNFNRITMKHDSNLIKFLELSNKTHKKYRK